MTDDEIKQELRKMLGGRTAGGILHLLAKVYSEEARKEQGNPALRDDLMTVEGALTVAGFGVDAVCPLSKRTPLCARSE